ncbi:MAG: hypothetical protein COB67_13880 [SAR324 cluster bacterium]|uniref:AAA+ ATPase domain-containing protein n=1 Tax=SAR324 cluster bacterium TaxID=2024889 RepID=A0A2A4SKG4_9DELT|nr:MAG: hypothetical protein COB67_13880 [SAR324 cluster bacterium]
MGIATVNTATILGVDAHIIEVEADVSIGLGSFNIVGLPDGAIKESRDRVIAALNNATDGFPIRKVIVNLAPADIRKMGTGFDLPIAIAVLEAHGKIPSKCLEGYLLIAELALSGKLRAVEGILAVALAAKKAGIMKLIVAPENAGTLSLLENLEIHTAATLQEVVAHCHGQQLISPHQYNSPGLSSLKTMAFDFSDVKGQETAKRSLEIAAAGMHNVLFTGPPGSGKSMLSKRLPTILPPLLLDEILEVTKIHSIAGTLEGVDTIVATRPFRSPHHSVSGAGIIGGGTIPKPGEISLAHLGVLFLDELPEFPRRILDLLRQPVEDKRITISRANISLVFPSDFILLAAMNPCPCGYLGDKERGCSCTASAIMKYRSRISGPMIDRIDLQIEMPALSYEELNFSPKGEKSERIRARVLGARAIQLERFKENETKYNSNMQHKDLECFCELDQEGHILLAQALKKFHLSSRAHDSILKVARTIADLEGAKKIQIWHLAEALNYRCLDKEINF